MEESESTSFHKGNHAFHSKRPRAFQEVEIHRKDLEALVWMFPNLSANRQDGRMHAQKTHIMSLVFKNTSNRHKKSSESFNDLDLEMKFVKVKSKVADTCPAIKLLWARWMTSSIPGISSQSCAAVAVMSILWKSTLILQDRIAKPPLAKTLDLKERIKET